MLDMRSARVLEQMVETREAGVRRVGSEGAE